MSFIFNTLLAVDMFGNIPSFTIESKNKFKSLQGLFLTIISLAITLVSIRGSINNWYFRLNPTLTLEKRLNNGSVIVGGIKHPLFFGIRKLDLQNMFLMSYMSTNEFPPFELINIIIKEGILVSNKSISLQKCPKLNYGGPGVSMTSFLCLMNEVELYDKDNGNNSSRILITLDRTKYDKIFYPGGTKVNTLIIGFQETFINLDNYDNYINLSNSAIDLTAKKSPESYIQTITFKKQTYKKKLPILSKSAYEEISYPTLDINYQRSSFTPPEFIASAFPIFGLTIEFSKTEEITNIIYFEITDLISIIGGTFSVIVTVINIIAIEINKIPFKIKLANIVFKFYFNKNTNDENEMKVKDENNTLIDFQKISIKLKNRLATSTPIKISSFDLYKIKIKTLFGKQLSIKEKSFNLVNNYIDESLNISNFIKMPLLITQLTDYCLGSFSDIIKIDNINIDSIEKNEQKFNLPKEIYFSKDKDKLLIEKLEKIDFREANEKIMNCLIENS